MPSGTMKWFNAPKGYGFFTGGGKDVFHISAVEKAGLSDLRAKAAMALPRGYGERLQKPL